MTPGLARTFDSLHTSTFLSLSQSVSTEAFAAGIFITFGIGTRVRTPPVVIHRTIPSLCDDILVRILKCFTFYFQETCFDERVGSPSAFCVAPLSCVLCMEWPADVIHGNAGDAVCPCCSSVPNNVFKIFVCKKNVERCH